VSYHIGNVGLWAAPRGWNIELFEKVIVLNFLVVFQVKLFYIITGNKKPPLILMELFGWNQRLVVLTGHQHAWMVNKDIFLRCGHFLLVIQILWWS